MRRLAQASASPTLNRFERRPGDDLAALNSPTVRHIGVEDGSNVGAILVIARASSLTARLRERSLETAEGALDRHRDAKGG